MKFHCQCESNTTMVMQLKTWMTLFDKWKSHFIASNQNFGSNLSLTNCHLLILDDHNLHVTLDAMHKTMGVGLNLITMPSHNSCALQPLDVSCFKLFKTTFKAYKDVWTLANKGRGC